ncbi:hypothetical protein WH297_06185 [Ochrobactrum vermis]|uniref:Restriction endonuclease type IV Mrr domain-containing protein n=1 Tax=Ochrobactrum vermis TaxID=1827297 RepID=A0ABU8PAP7_9HYPH|nr:hypothetical protein [Ochrobactrum vermis]PQZ29816.1 hypothetical protein CQZ93_06325 [Ochrobactrum vermis]
MVVEAMKKSPASYRGKTEFPYETFVEDAVKRWLVDQAFEITRNGHIDVFAVREENDIRQVWHVECKGQTSQNTVDFCTAIGQLLKRINERGHHHAIAFPDLPVFRRQSAQFAPWVLAALNLHWIWVDENGGVSVDFPPVLSRDNQ